ncbi:MAG: N-acetyltransferase [Parcubacteria group bacterium]
MPKTNRRTGIVRSATLADLRAIASINAHVFLGNRDDPKAAYSWTLCGYRATPKERLFVCCVGGRIVGYTKWAIHGGFRRPTPVVELVELGIDPFCQGRGYGTLLTEDGLTTMATWVRENNRRIESHITFIVWCYADNQNAVAIYKRHFGKHCGTRKQHADRREVCFMRRVPLVLPLRATSKAA